jgi:hypothetical protein
MSGTPRRKIPKAIVLSPLIVISVVVAAVVRPRSPLDVELTATELVVRASFGGSFPLASIHSVRLEDEVPRMRKRFGLNSATTFAGRFSSDELGGSGHAYIRRGAPPYIVARTEGGFLVLNMNDAAGTQALFERLERAISSPPRP